MTKSIYVIPTIDGQDDFSVEAETMRLAMEAAENYAKKNKNCVLDETRDPYKLPPPGHRFQGTEPTGRETPQRVFVTRAHKNTKIDFNADRLELLGDIARGARQIIYVDGISPLDEKTSSLINKYLSFGIVVKHGIGNKREAIHMTASGVFLLNQCIELGWKYPGDG